MLVKRIKSYFTRGNKRQSVAPESPRGDEVRLDQVSLSLGGKQILDQVSLSLNEPRIGLLGNNGSGKSTLIRLLNGLHLPDSGSVSLFGLDSREFQRQLPRYVGFIFQNPDHQLLFPTAVEELSFSLEQIGIAAPEAEQKALDFLRMHQLHALAELPVHTLSEGQKQLICILAVLIMKPRLLLLDEPFASLDLPNRIRLQKLLEAHCEQIIMVSHELESLRDFDRLIWLHEGSIRADGPPRQVISDYQGYVEKQVSEGGVLL